MKTILHTLLLLISIVTFSQESFNGKYCTNPAGASDITCIEFKENSRFEYQVGGCLGISSIGTGRFELKNDNLNLIFDKKEQPIQSNIKIAKTQSKSKSKNEVEFEFNITDENNIPLYVNIIQTPEYKGFEVFKENNIINQTKNDSIYKYQILSLGYQMIELELDNSIDKKIDVIMYPNQPKVISDTIYSLKLTKKKDVVYKTGINFWNNFMKIKN